MQVLQSRLQSVFVSLGVDTAKDATCANLAAKANRGGGMARLLDPGQVIGDRDDAELFTELVAAQDKGELIEVVADGVTAAPDVKEEKVVTTKTKGPSKAPAKKSPAKPAPKKVPVKAVKKAPVKKTDPKKAPVKTAPKPAPKKVGAKSTSELRTMTWAQKVEYWKTHPMKPANRPGVFSTIIEELKVAGSKSTPVPVTKVFLLGVLKAKFPDRDPRKMETTINNMVPSGLMRNYGMTVGKAKTESGALGYWLAPEPTRGDR